MCEFDKPDKIFASDLYLIYKRSPSPRIYISDKDRPLIIYLLLNNKQLFRNVTVIIATTTTLCKHIIIKTDFLSKTFFFQIDFYHILRISIQNHFKDNRIFGMVLIIKSMHFKKYTVVITCNGFLF